MATARVNKLVIVIHTLTIELRFMHNKCVQLVMFFNFYENEERPDMVIMIIRIYLGLI